MRGRIQIRRAKGGEPKEYPLPPGSLRKQIRHRNSVRVREQDLWDEGHLSGHVLESFAAEHDRQDL